MAKERSLGRGGLVAPLPRRYQTPLLFITATLTLCGTVQAGVSSTYLCDLPIACPFAHGVLRGWSARFTAWRRSGHLGANSLSVRARCIALYGLAQVGTFGSLNQTHSGHFDETCWRAASRDPSFRKYGSVGSGVKSFIFPSAMQSIHLSWKFVLVYDDVLLRSGGELSTDLETF